MAKTRKCIFCGREYEYCPNCNDYSRYPKWMFNFDDEKCHELYNIIGAYNIGLKTKEDIKTVLDKYNITDYSVFNKSVTDRLNSIFPVDTPVVSVVEENLITDEIQEEKQMEESEPEENVAVEDSSTLTSFRRRKMNKKRMDTEEANTEE